MKKLIIGILAGLYAFMASSVSYAADLADTPLFLQNSAYPNLLFNLSIETPLGSEAYNDQRGVPNNSCTGRKNYRGLNFGSCYFPDAEYIGYFDPKKCYDYDGDKFLPKVATTNGYQCSGRWSGNFLNWVTTRAIDPLVYSMTGGNRVVDTVGASAETVVRRAKSSGFGAYTKVISSNSSIAGVAVAPSTVTPLSGSTAYFRNNGGRYDFTFGDISFSRSGHSLSAKGTYNVKVKVCDPSVGLESNCRPYSDGTNTYYKPEGLIQENKNRMRFAVSSYSADNSFARNGGVMRTNMKYVGAEIPGAYTVNLNKEINADGTFFSDPDGLAGSGGVVYSGVINYLNKFTDFSYKSGDPASELFYEALRFYKGFSGPTPEYISGLTNAQKGGFPVLTQWEDPILYSCQQNFIVGIADAYSWADKRVPGTFFQSDATTGCNDANWRAGVNDCGDPTNADSAINATELTNAVGALEGIGKIGERLAPTSNCATGIEASCTSNGLSSGRENSYYIAGLAHYANTQDIRPQSDMPGVQTVKTYMIDSQEFLNNPLGSNKYNQLWLTGKYGGFDDLNGNGVPDDDVDGVNEWDNDGDGKPDSYILASQPSDMIEGLNNAFEDVIKLSASASAASVNTTSIRSNTQIYQSVFTNDNWNGNLLAYKLEADGSVGNLQWDAKSNLPASGARRIFSIKDNNNETPIKFLWGNLTANQKALLKNQDTLLEFLRGDRTNEFGSGTGVYRERDAVLGDIVHSSPVSVGVPRAPFNRLAGAEGTSYLTFITNNKSRRETVYVGGNDGMLHGFDAATGVEVMAYIPKAVYPNLADLADFNYSHKYFVDGQMTAGEAYLSNQWETVLLGTLGAGGKAIFALNITNPASFTGAASNVVKWEFDGGTASDDLGFITGKAVITKLNNGKWAAVFGNGYNSNNQQASLFVVDLEDGSLIKKIDTGVGSSTLQNGLSEPALIDTNGDLTADFVYAGDLQGNVWKFDLTNANVSRWDVAVKQGSTPLPIFTAEDSSGNRQPITTRPAVGRAAENGDGYLIYFGTGQYMFRGDAFVPANAPVNSIYALWDNDIDRQSKLLRSSDLVQQTITQSTATINAGQPNQSTVRVRRVSNNAVDYTAKKGWYMDLIENGERVVARLQNQFNKIFFTTYTPSANACDNGGTSWLMAIDAFDGQASEIFDIDNNNTFDAGIAGIAILGTTSEAARLCLDASCEQTVSIVSSQSGELTTTNLKGDNTTVGRQSWRQIK